MLFTGGVVSEITENVTIWHGRRFLLGLQLLELDVSAFICSVTIVVDIKCKLFPVVPVQSLQHIFERVASEDAARKIFVLLGKNGS